MAEEQIPGIPDGAGRNRQPPDRRWQHTLWAMVGIQFVMTMAFSMLTPIMPLFLPVLGVESAGAVAPPRGGAGRSVLASLFAVVRSPALLALFFVLLTAQFGVRTVQPVVTLFVQELVGPRPDLATLAGIAFSITGAANVIAAPFLGNKSDRIGYRRVLLIGLFGAAVTTLPQALAGSFWVFTAQRFAVGLFVGGILPTAHALIGRLVPRSERGTVYGITASAMFFGNSLGPLSGGAIAAAFGLRWVFLMTGLVLLANLLWVFWRAPEYREGSE
jgi:DHA1 family multidrug resistance protein-like MFS transporter